MKATEESSPPVGLVREVTFTTTNRQMTPGDRVLIVTDGVTEAENAAGDYFGFDTFYEMATCKSLLEIVEAVAAFSAGVPPGDDCTGMELVYLG